MRILPYDSKSIDFTSPRTSSGQASQPYETVPIGTILSPSEGGRKPRGENHQALAVKGERHPTCGLELNPGCSGERRMCGFTFTTATAQYENQIGFPKNPSRSDFAFAFAFAQCKH